MCGPFNDSLRYKLKPLTDFIFVERTRFRVYRLGI